LSYVCINKTKNILKYLIVLITRQGDNLEKNKARRQPLEKDVRDKPRQHGRAKFHLSYRVSWLKISTWFSSQPNLKGRAGFHPSYMVFGLRISNLVFFITKSKMKGRVPP